MADSEKTILVVGGTSGIGRAVVHDLLEKNVRVLVAARDAPRRQRSRPGGGILPWTLPNRARHCRLCPTRCTDWCTAPAAST